MQYLQPNTTLQGGKYRIEQVLGQGGFGRVLIGLLLILLPVLVMAQASGGQIRRQTEKTSPRRNVVKISEPDGHLNGHGYVDLGLPSKTKWATCNVGANSPEDYGYYLAWGEVEQKNEYNYKETPLCGVAIDDISNNENYDAAKIKWGDGWSIPTKYQWDELIRFCKIRVTKKNGVNGVLLVGRNGKSVFFPSGGNGKNGTFVDFVGSEGGYWSSNADYTYRGKIGYPPDAYSTFYLTWSTDECGITPHPEWRGHGFNIRPVTK